MTRYNEHIPCDDSIPCKRRETGGCFEDIDHFYWPASEYRKKAEQDFRNHVLNKTLTCRALHDERHATEEPPEKPSHQCMVEFLKEES